MKSPWANEDYKATAFIRNSYLSRGRYFDQLNRFLKFFPRNQLLLIEAGEFFRDTQECLRKVFSFAGVSETAKIFDTRAVNTGNNRADVDPEVKTYLRDYFKLQNEKLFELTGTRYDW